MIQDMHPEKLSRPSGRRAGFISCLLIAFMALAILLPGGIAMAGESGPPRIQEMLDRLPPNPPDRQHGLGYKPSPPGKYKPLVIPEGRKRTHGQGAPLGVPVDLSSQLPPVGNQGNQGSCVGWATSYYYKSWVEKQEHTGWSLSNQWYEFSPSFMYNQINGGHDGGANFQDAFNLIQTKGDVDIAEFPYNQNNYTNQPTTAQQNAAKPYRMPSGWGYFWLQQNMGPYNPPNNIANAKAWLDSGKMFVVGIPVYNDFPGYAGNPNKSYYDYNGSAAIAGGHALCVCGYNDNADPGGIDADHKGGFKIVNSWGAGWNGGSAGFVYLSYDFVKRYVWEAWSMGDTVGDGPSLTSLSRNSGPVGASVVLAGNNFGTRRRNARVSFNGTSATDVTWANEQITAKVPSGAASGPVTACDWEGTASNPISFTVDGGGAEGPIVSAVDPAQGANTGALNVAVTGSNFAAGSQVKLASDSAPEIQATGENVVNSGRVECAFDLKGATAGPRDVVVTNLDGLYSTLSGGFTVTGQGGHDTYEPNNSFARAYGPIAPNTNYESYIFSGYDEDYYRFVVPQGCEGITAVLASIPAGCDYDYELYNPYGQLVAGSWSWSNADERIQYTPPWPGTYYLCVYPYDGYSDTDSYLLAYSLAGGGPGPVPVPVPSIESIYPGAGVTGTEIAVTGSGFGETQGPSFVVFRESVATGYTSWSDTEITVVVPLGAFKQVPVHVVTPGGMSNGVTFSVTPRINKLNPSAGPPGTVVTISGNAFGPSRGGSFVTFGGGRVTCYQSWRNSQVRVKVPAGAYRQALVQVHTSGGISNGVTFNVSPKINKLEPAGGSPGSGSVVTITGAALGANRGRSYVSFGALRASNYISWRNSQVKVRVPAGAYGSVKIKVFTTGGSSKGIDLQVL